MIVKREVYNIAMQIKKHYENQGKESPIWEILRDRAQKIYDGDERCPSYIKM